MEGPFRQYKFSGGSEITPIQRWRMHAFRAGPIKSCKRGGDELAGARMRGLHTRETVALGGNQGPQFQALRDRYDERIHRQP